MTADYSKRGSDPREQELIALAAIAAAKMGKRPAPRWALIAAGLEPAPPKGRSASSSDQDRDPGIA
ncbi:hypothetical protein ABLE94_00850 [Gordonia sp. VNK1]|uniref:hypothetical protein n=1 Tax=Gordonia oleivorans TaxID=3156618 RepID=UPI0032B37FDC